MRSKEHNQNYPEFDADFVWGSYFSAHGLEGGDFHTDWWHWEQRPGRIAGGGVSNPAAEHWARYKQDYALAARFGIQTLLVGISWARVQPEQGRFDEAALEHYAQRLQAVRDAGMTPWVLPLEFALPNWLAHQGGWAASTFPTWYQAYLRRLVEALAPCTAHWIPFHQPGHMTMMVYQARMGPGAGGHRFQRKSLYHRALQNLDDGARRAYATIKTQQPEAQVGASLRLDACHPHDPHSPWDYRACQRHTALAMHPYAALPALNAPPMDFVLAACYGRRRVRFTFCPRPTTAQSCDQTGAQVPPDVVHPDPGALAMALPRWTAFQRPIYVMSGLPAQDDTDRRNYLRHLWRLIGAYRAQGVAIHGFFHHALLDGFEWRRGYADRYGLIHVDADSQARTPNPSALLQQELTERGTLHPSAWEDE